MKAAIYARMRNGKQREASTEEQVGECRCYAKEHGLEVSENLVFIDGARLVVCGGPEYRASGNAGGR